MVVDPNRRIRLALALCLVLGCGAEQTQTQQAAPFGMSGAGTPAAAGTGMPANPSGGTSSLASGGGGGAAAATDGSGGSGPMPARDDAGQTPTLDAAVPPGTQDDDAAPTDAGGGAEPTTGAFPPVTDFASPGPFGNETMANVGPNSNYTVYRPAELAPGGAKNPIVGWMSGGGTTHTFYTLLPHLASHGFVVVASNTVPGIGTEAALGDEIIAGIDWAIAENARADSAFFEKLDTQKLASTGYSMGSLATFMIAKDPRLTTTVHISGGNMAPERVQNLHAPAAFICGVPGGATCNILSGDCDIAGANCKTDFDNATTPVFYATFPSGHLGILTPPFTERINGMTLAWLRHRLMGDTTLASWFVGDSCTYCQDSNWTVQQKNLD